MPTTSGEVIVARARTLIGARFRPQGRRPEIGLDCVGVAALAVGITGDRLRSDYALRGATLHQVEDELRKLGLRPVVGAADEGNVLVVQAGPAQIHLGIFTGTGLVHADCGLRQVVERPLPLPWPVLGAWRVGEPD